MWTIFFFLSLYWICYSIASVLCFLVLGHLVCGILAPWPGIEPAPPAVEGEVLTTGLPGKSIKGRKEARDRKREEIIESDDGKKERKKEGKKGRWWRKVKRKERRRKSKRKERGLRREGGMEGGRKEEIQSWPVGEWDFWQMTHLSFPPQVSKPRMNTCLEFLHG